MTALVHYVLLSIAFCFVKMTVKLSWILKNDFKLHFEASMSLKFAGRFFPKYLFFLFNNECVCACLCVGVHVCTETRSVEDV